MTNPLSVKAADIMSSPAISLGRTTPIREALRLFLERKFTGCPVIDENGQGIGVLTLRDIARYAEWHLESEDAAEDQRDAELARELDRRKGLERGETRSLGMHVDPMRRANVEQIMTPRMAFVRKDSTVEDIIRTMDELEVHRVFVADAKGKLLGVVSTVDIVQTFYGAAKKPAARAKPNPASKRKR